MRHCKEHTNHMFQILIPLQGLYIVNSSTSVCALTSSCTFISRKEKNTPDTKNIVDFTCCFEYGVEASKVSLGSLLESERIDLVITPEFEFEILYKLYV